MVVQKSWKVWTGLSIVVCTLFLMSGGPSFSAAEDRGEAKLEIGGKNITIDYGRPSIEGRGYKSMKESIPEGTLWRMGSNSTTTLETDGDLKFGDKTVPAGKYSLAGKKTADGWDLLVHPDFERRGSAVPEDGYTATIPLKVGEAKKEAELMTIRLREKEGKGMFALVWGDQKLSARFTVAD